MMDRIGDTGLVVITGDVFVDDRGELRFINDFNFEGVKRFYQVENHCKNFVRAWHGHRKEAKHVYVASGSALVGVVKMDEEDAEPFKCILSASKPRVLYIPSGYANGFMNLEDNTIIQFFSSTTLEESKDDDIRFPYNKWNIWGIEYR